MRYHRLHTGTLLLFYRIYVAGFIVDMIWTLDRRFLFVFFSMWVAEEEEEGASATHCKRFFLRVQKTIKRILKDDG